MMKRTELQAEFLQVPRPLHMGKSERFPTVGLLQKCGYLLVKEKETRWGKFKLRT